MMSKACICSFAAYMSLRLTAGSSQGSVNGMEKDGIQSAIAVTQVCWAVVVVGLRI